FIIIHTPHTYIYTLSLHDALPIYLREEGYGLSGRTHDVRRDHQPPRRRKSRFIFDQVVRFWRGPSSSGGAAALSGHLRLPAGRRDRKSTRLNSSHEWISYAVFCLK